MSSHGQVLFRPTMAEYESVDTFSTPISSSEQGDRLALNILTIRGVNRTLDIGGHVTARRIAVYDIETEKEVASIPVHASHRYGLEFALSPDGHRLAILEDDMLWIFDLDRGLGEKDRAS